MTASSARRDRDPAGPGWLASLLGIAFLVTAGFAFGLVVGVVKEEPDLVVGHLAGRGEEVPWSSAEGLETGDPGLGAGVLERELAGEDAHAAVEASGQKSASDASSGQRVAAVSAAAPAAPSPAALPRMAKNTPEPVARPAVSAPPPVRAASVSSPSPVRAVSELPATGDGFSVQVGSFAESEGAEKVARELEGKGYPVYVTPAAVAGGGRWRVRVGPVATLGEAERFAGRLKSEEQLPTWVLSEGGG